MHKMNLEVFSQQPLQALSKTPVLLVHGAWHGAWCWKMHFADYLAQQGFQVHAISLRGHGNSEGRQRLRWTGVADYVDDVDQVARQLSAPPIVIGHSMGGLVVQKYLEIHEAPAGVLMASIPPTGVLLTALRLARRHPWLMAKVNATLSLYPLISSPELAKELLFSNKMPLAQVEIFWQQMQDESYRCFVEMLGLGLPKPEKVNTPLLILGGDADTLVSPDQVKATARAYGTQAVILPNIAHDMMLEPGWQTVADVIVSWLRTNSPECNKF
jgi:pimeloyl-ACP methyl ester carboxylesterase